MDGFISYLFHMNNFDWVMVLGFFMMLAGVLDVYIQGKEYLHG